MVMFGRDGFECRGDPSLSPWSSAEHDVLEIRRFREADWA